MTISMQRPGVNRRSWSGRRAAAAAVIITLLPLAAAPRRASACDEIAGQYIVKFNSKGQAHRAARRIGAFALGGYDGLDGLAPGLALVKVPSAPARNMVRRGLQRRLRGVEYLEPDCRVGIEPLPAGEFVLGTASGSPLRRGAMDELYSQWAFDNQGQAGGRRDVDLNGPEARAILAKNSAGRRLVVAAVVDSGVDYNHPLLRHSLWVNRGENAKNGRDDDKNGVIDDIYGANMVRGSGDPMDDNGHGTHVAGIVSTTADFGLIRGVPAPVSVMSVKALAADGSGSLSNILRALQYVLAMRKLGVNIKVVNASFGGPGACPRSFASALTTLGRSAIVFVAAAGNESTNNDKLPQVPANCPGTNLISVTAVNNQGLLSSFSNYGKLTVHIAAPGEEILSYWPRSRLAIMSGTSMAAPFVTGSLALGFGMRPALTAAGMRSLLVNTGKNLQRSTGQPTVQIKKNAIPDLAKLVS